MKSPEADSRGAPLVRSKCVARLAARGRRFRIASSDALRLWNLGMATWQHARNPVPGNFYTVDGLQMHIDCSGGRFTAVVMEAAANAPWSLWRKVQPSFRK